MFVRLPLFCRRIGGCMDYSRFFPILEYYEKFVIPLNPRRYRVKSEKMMVCPLHDDHDPSMGIIHSSKDGEIFHCFGCNRWGNVVDLHQGVCKRLLGRYVSRKEAVRELCKILNVDYDTVCASESESEESDSSEKAELALDEAISRFDISDFKELFLQGKLSGKGIGYFNSLMMIMINELKERQNSLEE